MNTEVGRGNLEVGSSNVAFDKLRRGKIGKGAFWKWEVGPAVVIEGRTMARQKLRKSRELF